MPPRMSLAEPRRAATRHVGCVVYPFIVATVAAAVVVVQYKVCPRVMYERTRLWPYSARTLGTGPTALASSHCLALHHSASKVVRTNNNADQGREQQGRPGGAVRFLRARPPARFMNRAFGATMSNTAD